MENEKEIQNNEEEKTTPEGTDQSGEENTSEDTNSGEDEVVSISAKELETLKKKSLDFEKSVELKRLSKLENKLKQDEGSGEARADGLSELKSEISALKEMVATGQTVQKNVILRDAYRDFIGEHSWANNDEIFEKISTEFKADSVMSKEDAVKQLKSISASKFPNEYESHLSAKAKAQALAETQNIKSGGGGAASGDNKLADTDATDEEKISKKFMKNFPPGWAINEKL
jgi:hypothetical protein